MYMRIKYHFLANLHVTRRAWNTSVSGILFNKPCRVELIVIIGHKQHQGTHFLYTIENSPMDFSREAKHRRILTNSNISRGEKLHEVWIIVKSSRSRKLDFANIFNHFNLFSKYCNLFHMLLIHFSCYFGKRRRFLPPGAYAFLTSSVYIPVNTVFNQIW